MDSPPEHPEMWRRQGKSRKYGANDYERFDKLASTHASLGSRTFGKVGVDCRFLFAKSRWGTMGKGPRKKPAGVVYLDLAFHEPKGYRLDRATVKVTLDDRHEELDMLLRRRPRTTQDASRGLVHMTDYYGPRGLVGPEKAKMKRKQMEFKPSVEGAGFGASLFGLTKEETYTSSHRWKFSGHLLTGERDSWRSEALQWEMSENDHESEASHSPEVHTAFAFQHGGLPFFMKIEVDCHLKDKLKNRWARFRASTRGDKDAAVTLVNFGADHIFNKPLDFVAEQLHFEMEQANLESIPMVVSDPQTATYSAEQTETPSGLSLGDPGRLPSQATMAYQAKPQLENIHRPPRLLSNSGSMEDNQRLATTLANLANIIHADLSPPKAALERGDDSDSVATTNVGPYVNDTRDLDRTNESRQIRLPNADEKVKQESWVVGLWLWLLVLVQDYAQRQLSEASQDKTLMGAAPHQRKSID